MISTFFLYLLGCAELVHMPLLLALCKGVDSAVYVLQSIAMWQAHGNFVFNFAIMWNDQILHS